MLTKLSGKLKEYVIELSLKLGIEKEKPIPEKELVKMRKIMIKNVGKTFPIRIIGSGIVTGAGTNKIYISSSLYDKLSFKERLAVIFHEIAHIESDRILPPSLKHVMDSFSCFTLLIALIMSYKAYLFLLSLGLSFSSSLTLTSLVFLRILFMSISLESIIEEIFADKFAKEKIGKKFIIGALKKLKKANEELKESLFKIHFREKIILWLLQAGFYLLLWPFKTHPSIEERIRLLNSK
jgi:Zn-dependent protease with chaperone function